jgi:hypothetical protein
MSHVLDGAAVKQVAQQAMPMRGHRNQIALFGLGRLEDLLRGIAQRQVDFHRQPRRPQPCRRLLEILPIGFHLLGLRQVQTMVVQSGPAVGQVHEQKLRLEQLRELLHVGHQRLVSAAVLQRHEDLLIHAKVSRPTRSGLRSRRGT